jgi:ABC-type Fe3+ transport system permease subunit
LTTNATAAPRWRRIAGITLAVAVAVCTAPIILMILVGRMAAERR